MICLRRSGSGFVLGSADIGHLEYIATGALDRGETVDLQIDGQPWIPVTSRTEVSETLRELYEELDARRDALEDSGQLPLLGGDQ